MSKRKKEKKVFHNQSYAYTLLNFIVVSVWCWKIRGDITPISDNYIINLAWVFLPVLSALFVLNYAAGWYIYMRNKEMKADGRTPY